MKNKMLILLFCSVLSLTAIGCANTNKNVSGTDVNDPYKVNDKIIEYFQTNGVKDYENYCFNYVDTNNEKVIVGLLDNSKEQQDKFKELIVDSELIIFVKGERLVDEANNEEIIEKLKSTTKITIEDSINSVTIKTINNRSNIEDIVNLISNSIKLSEDAVVTSESNTWIMEMYDEENQLINKIYIWKNGYIGFSRAKEYSISLDNLKCLKEVIE